MTLLYLLNVTCNYKCNTVFPADVNHCMSNPCQNGGSCMDKVGVGYSCKCAEGYRSTHCEEGDSYLVV